MIQRTFNRLIICLISVLCTTMTFATCTKKASINNYDSNSVPIIFGTVNLPSPYLLPVGSLMASTVTLSSGYTYSNNQPSTVFWECDKADLPNIKFLVANNGDDRVGGFWDMGGKDGIPPNVYATYFQYVGLRQIMSGVVLTRYWQAIPVTSYITSGDKIQIRLQDIPPLQAELYRISELPPKTGAVNQYCALNGSGGMRATGPYDCIQPTSYIQFQGPGLKFDDEGSDSAYKWAFWPSDGIGYYMYNVNTLWNSETCVARNATPQVNFDPIQVNQLNSGQSVQANFTVSLECSDSAKSGTGSQQTAIGIQVSPNAYSNATNLGLVNTANGVTALVSDNYGAAGMAKGVGIYLKNPTNGANMNFVGQPGVAGGGANAGWYPVLDNASKDSSSSQSGYSYYTRQYTASLSKLQGNAEAVTPGKVQATAYVLVKVQ